MAVAIDGLVDAFGATREILLPFSWGRWLRLALIALFVGGTGAPPVTGSWNIEADPPPDVSVPADLSGFPPNPGAAPGIVTAIAATAVALALLWTLFGAVMEFVLLASVREETISLRRLARENLGQGLRLFAFRLVLGLLELGIIGGVAWLVLSGEISEAAIVAALVVLVPLFVLLAGIGWLVDEFTTAFAAPIMLREDRGVMSAWRRLWSVLWAEPGEFVLYAVLRFFVTIVGGMAVSFVVGIGLLVLAIPFVVLALVGIGAVAAGAELLGIAWIAVVVVLFGMVALATFAFAAVPVVVYLRYYSLFVLGDVRTEFDLIPERRAAVRGETEGTAD